MEEAPIAEIKPNVRKAFTLNLLFAAGIVALIAIVLLYLQSIVGLDVIADSLREVGDNFSPQRTVAYMIFFSIFFTALLLISNYIALSHVGYIFYPDKIRYNRSFFVIVLGEQEVSYANVARVSYEKKSLNTGKVTIELTGASADKIEMEFIDNPEQVVSEIQKLITDYRAQYYAKYTQNYRYEHIMEPL